MYLISKKDCPNCVLLKRYLGDSVDYTEITLENDPDKFYEILGKLNVMSVPVLIKGDKYVVGWNRTEVNKLVLE